MHLQVSSTALTMAPRETDSMEKVLKSRLHRGKENGVPAPKRHKISNYGVVLTNEDYQKKIAEAKRKDDEKKEKTEVRNVKKKIIPCINRKTKMKIKKGKQRDFRKKFLAMVQNSEEEEQNEVVIHNDVYQNEVNNKVLEEEQSEEIDFFTYNCFVSMMLRFQCGSRFYMKGKHSLGKFCVLKMEMFKFAVLKNLLVLRLTWRWNHHVLGSTRHGGGIITCLVPQDMEVESSRAWFHKTWRWNHHVLGSTRHGGGIITC